MKNNVRWTAFMCALATTCSLALVGCGSQAAPENITDIEVSSSQNSEEIVGGWEVTTEASTTALTSEESDIFERATEGLTGVGYEPVRVLATQVVAGTNYAYLCLGTTVTAEPVTSWYVVTVYNDLDNNASVTSVEEIDLADIHVPTTASQSELLGGWILTTPNDGASLPADVQTAFDVANHAHDEATTLSPIALLGTQLVSGTNYKILCESTSENGGLYIVDMYETLDGDASFISVDLFDLLAYTS